MAKVIWLGEDSGDIAGPSFTTWGGGIKFPKDIAVEVTDPETLRRARTNIYFKVIEGKQQEKRHVETQGEKEHEEKDEKAKTEDGREKGTGYSPVKKKVRKKKPESRADDPATI